MITEEDAAVYTYEVQAFALDDWCTSSTHESCESALEAYYAFSNSFVNIPFRILERIEEFKEISVFTINIIAEYFPRCQRDEKPEFYVDWRKEGF